MRKFLDGCHLWIPFSIAMFPWLAGLVNSWRILTCSLTSLVKFITLGPNYMGSIRQATHSLYPRFTVTMESRHLAKWALSCLLPLLPLLFLWLNIRSRTMPFREAAGTAVRKEEVGLRKSYLSQARPRHRIFQELGYIIFPHQEKTCAREFTQRIFVFINILILFLLF